MGAITDFFHEIAEIFGGVLIRAFSKYRCPRCNFPIWRGEYTCPNCGQAVEWTPKIPEENRLTAKEVRALQENFAKITEALKKTLIKKDAEIARLHEELEKAK